MSTAETRLARVLAQHTPSFTPGPWKVGYDRRGHQFEVGAQHGVIVRIPFAMPEERACAEADARLIAASPALFAVLAEIVRAYEDSSDGEIDEAGRWLHAASIPHATMRRAVALVRTDLQARGLR